MHDHSFERICTQFAMWHPYILQIVMGLFNKCRSEPELAGAMDRAP